MGDAVTCKWGGVSDDIWSRLFWSLVFLLHLHGLWGSNSGPKICTANALYSLIHLAGPNTTHFQNLGMRALLLSLMLAFTR